MCCPQGVLSLAGGAILSGGAMKRGFMKGCSMKGVFHGRGCHEGGTMKDPPPPVGQQADGTEEKQRLF